MAKSGTLALTLVLMAAAWTAISAQTSSSCTNVLISMSPCLNYITGNSSAPSSGCCSALGSVVKSQPQCLCQVISGSGSSSLGININRTQALQLPTACNVQTPSIARCSGAASPSGSSSTTGTPSSDNSGSATNTPTTSTSTSTGSTESPSIDTSKGHAMKSGLSLFLALFFMATSARDLLSVIFI